MSKDKHRTPYKPHEIEYIKNHLNDMTSKEIAQELGRSKNAVKTKITEIKKGMNINPITRQSNPFPVTTTTEMLICRYHKDNISKGMRQRQSLKDIAETLGRPVTVIKEVLERCQKTGEYERHNLYGTEFVLKSGSGKTIEK